MQVRSVTLDTWLPEQVAFMAATGNGIANAFWEAKLQPGTKPHYDAPELGTFIRRKVCAPPTYGHLEEAKALEVDLACCGYISRCIKILHGQ
jgi:hypothetical protein